MITEVLFNSISIKPLCLNYGGNWDIFLKGKMRSDAEKLLNDDAFLTVTLIYQRKLLNYTENENI